MGNTPLKVAFIDGVPTIAMQNLFVEGGNDVHLVFYKPDFIPVNCKSMIVHICNSSEEIQDVFIENRFDIVINSDTKVLLDLPELMDLISDAFYIGPSVFTSKLETDRLFAADFISSICNLKIPETTTDLKEAKDLSEYVVVQTNTGGRILAQNDALNLFAHTIVMHHRDLDTLRDVPNLIFKRFIDGPELGMAGYFTGKNFIRPFLMAQEYKNFFPGNINFMQCGEAGTCGLFSHDLPKPFKEIMDAHIPYIESHVGFFDIYTIFDKDGNQYFLEYTPRIGYPTEHEVMSVLAISYMEFLECIRQGKNFKIKNSAFASALIYNLVNGLPYTIPYPKDVTIPIFAEILGEFLSTDGYGRNSSEICCVTCSDSTIKGAVSKLYSILPKMRGFGTYYLTDIGSNWDSQFEKSDFDRYKID